ncbi:hypothetical protein CRYUN_Cryun40dG0080500 [Craigia yunnanensis]
MASSALEDLVRCAQAIEDGDLKLADSLLERIWNLASDESDKLQRNLVKFFAEALVRRACGLHSDGSYSTLELTPYFYPYWVQFSFHISVQNVIKNAVMGKKRLHLIDFYIPHVRGWGYLFDGLNSNDFLSVRVSAIIPFFLKKYLNIQKEKEYLSDQAKNDEIHEDNGSLVLFKKNRPMIFVSAWKLKDGEEHFNPSSDNLEEKGLNPSLQLEDRVQPLPYFPEGLSLNHLAAASEIYAMLEEVSVAYDIPLALKWACGVYVNEIGYKNTLSIQSTFCYARSYYAGFIENCGKNQLLEGHAIARKALQSSEHFHFEPSYLKLKKADHPLAANWVSPTAVMAICLQKYYNIDDVYVVEFFLPLESQFFLPLGSDFWALQIFNDLKNMKKKFVRVRGVLQGLNEQGGVIPNMHASSPPGPHKEGIGKQTPFEPLAINETEMVKAYVNNLPSSSAKRRKSDVWEEFEKQDVGGKKCTICKHCEREFDGSSKKGTIHLRNHLKTCKGRAENDRDQQVIFPAGRGDTKNGSASEGISSFDQDRSSMDVARMIIKNHFRLNIVEDEFFNILLKNLQPMFKLQSQEALSSYIFRVYEEEKHKLRGYFNNLSCRFNLTINLWVHDVEKITYCCYGVQFIDDDWELKKKILVLKSLGNQFDKRIFYENFKDFCVDWNFNKKICSVIIHNSSSCSEIAEEIRKSWHSFEASHPLSTFYLGSDECIRGLLGKDNSEGREYPLMNVKSDNNWSTCSMVLAIAAVLDPRFKFAFVEFSYQKIYGHGAAKIHLTKIRNAFTDIFNEYASNMYSDTNSSTLLSAEENTLKSFHKYVNTEASWKSELDKYVHQSIIDFTPEFDILGGVNKLQAFMFLGGCGLDPQIIEAMICGRDWLESPKESCPVVKLEDSPALAHHSDIERISSKSDNEALGNQDLGRGATWTQKDVRAYLLSPFTVEELEHFSKWKDHALSGESVGRDKIQGNALAPLLKIPPQDVDLEDAQNYYIEDTTFLIKGTKAESQVLSWVNQEDLKGVSKLFLPISLNEHWLLFFADIDDKKLLWLDSNEHSRMSNVLEKQVIQQWFLKFLLPSMKHDPKDWLFDVPKDIPLQKNSVDCALFVMKYADCHTHGNYFPFSQDDMPHFRYRTFLDLCLGSICPGRSQESMEASACSQDMLEMSKGRNVRRRHYRVVEQTPSGNWTAEFQDIPGRMHGIEAFETAEAAALAYDEAALWFSGSKAILNYPERVEGRLESGNKRRMESGNKRSSIKKRSSYPKN